MFDPVTVTSAKYAAGRTLRFIAICAVVAVAFIGLVKMAGASAKGAEIPAAVAICHPVEDVIAAQIALGARIRGDDAFWPSPDENRHLMLIDRGIWVDTYDRVTILSEDGTLTFVFSLAGCFLVAVKQLDDPVPRGTPA